MLERDAAEANDNIRRMLSVCCEFERIAKVVLDKAERELRGRGSAKRKLAAEKEKEKTGSVLSRGLEEGKSIEQMQVETQAAYRRPVQTPSLRKSLEASSTNSPAGSGSWGSTPGGSGSEYRTPSNANAGAAGMDGFQQQQQQQTQQHGHHHQHSNSGQWTTQPGGFSIPNGNTSTTYPQQQDFSQADLTANGANAFDPSTTSFSPPTFPAGMDMIGNTGGGAFGTNLSPDMSGGGAAVGSFQQPFVPQDLWQMPMTLEWDWAEGLGLGSFTPGPGMFDGFEGTGVMGDVDGGGGG